MGLKLAYNAAMSTVAGAATSVGSVFTATNNSISMLESFITKASNEQKRNHIADADIFEEKLLDRHAQEVTVLRAKAAEFYNQSPEHKAEYDAAHSKLKAKLDKFNNIHTITED